MAWQRSVLPMCSSAIGERGLVLLPADGVQPFTSGRASTSDQRLAPDYPARLGESEGTKWWTGRVTSAPPRSPSQTMRRASPTSPSEKRSRAQRPHRRAPARARRRALPIMATSQPQRCLSPMALSNSGTPRTSGASHRTGGCRIRTTSRAPFAELFEHCPGAQEDRRQAQGGRYKTQLAEAKDEACPSG